jgi:hypothetical protein
MKTQIRKKSPVRRILFRSSVLPYGRIAARAIFSTDDTRRLMTNTTTTIAMIAGLMLGSAFTAHAQTPSDPNSFLSISGGGQFQDRTFSETTTFSIFDDTGTVKANQTVGSGYVFDASVGYRTWRRLSIAVGVSTFRGRGTADALVTIPDPLRRGVSTSKPISASDYGDLNQTGTAINFQAVWIKPLTDKLGLWMFAGPSFIHVSQQVASATGTQNPVAAIVKDSANTGKAGTVGIDLNYKMNDRYSVGGFVRYAGGEVDLPSVSKLKVGGVQVAGGVRIRFDEF